MTLDRDRLDRLDFLIAELKKRGIYADLNLHVSRSYPDMPQWPGMPDFHKGVDNFHPKMIEWQPPTPTTCSPTRIPTRKTAMPTSRPSPIVEINNENALMQDWFGGRLDSMPPIYRDELAKHGTPG